MNIIFWLGKTKENNILIYLTESADTQRSWKVHKYAVKVEPTLFTLQDESEVIRQVKDEIAVCLLSLSYVTSISVDNWHAAIKVIV